MGTNIYYLELMLIFLNVILAVEIDEEGHTERYLIFGEKRQEALENNLGCKFIRINTSKLYDEHYETETDRVQTFISKFKNGKQKELEKKNQTKK